LSGRSKDPIDVLCLGVVANAPYSRLAYQALAYPPGCRFDSLIYSDEFKKSPLAASLLTSGTLVLICLITVSDRTNTSNESLKSDPLKDIIPIRWAELVEEVSDDRFKVRLGLTVGSHGMAPYSETRIEIENCLRETFSGKTDTNAARQNRLFDRGLNLNHPYLVSTTKFTSLSGIYRNHSVLPKSLFHLGGRHRTIRCPSIPNDVLTNDADRWTEVMRDVHQLTTSRSDCKYHSESSLRIVRVEKRRSTFLRKLDRDWVPVRQSDIGETTVYRFLRRRSHQVEVRTRKAGDSSRQSTTFALNIFQQIGTTRETPIQMTEGTLDHSIPILAGDKRVLGEMAIQFRTVDFSRTESVERTSYLTLPLQIVGPWPALSILVGSFLLALGVASGSIAEFVRAHHYLNVFMTVTSIASVSLAVAVLTYGFSRWS
jgi:hypothetical protein